MFPGPVLASRPGKQCDLGPHAFAEFAQVGKDGSRAGETEEETLRLIKEAITFHLEGLKQEGQELPEPHSFSAIVDISITTA